ncbi:MAG: PDZ domain-containing protein [Xanthomonadales bacterium]|nr:PDZ domain-containing protein [Xanthomonadales bacterium]
MYFNKLIAGLSLALVAFGSYAESTLLLRQPALSADRLAFVYAGDIWVANPDGSAPRRLTSSPADESQPSFSPDGQWLAYAGAHENNVDVYVISVDGGQPRRLTYHPGQDTPTGWTADGTAVTLVSARETDHGRSGQLYHVSVDGGLPVKRMEARVYRGVYDSIDARFAYIAHGSGYRGLFGGAAGWKGYRGGTTPAIMIMDMAAQTVTTVPGEGATNFNPMWLGERLYFISDREDKQFNIFRYDAESGAINRISDEQEWDIRAADGHGDTIVYEAGGQLKRLSLADGSVSAIAVSINPDLPQLRTQWKNAAGNIERAALSPSGKRAVVTARGEVFTVPTDEGSTRNVTGTGERREYTAMWSPDGNEIAYIVDSLSGQSLVLEDQTGMGDTREYELGTHFYTLLDWSAGDDARIIFQDNHLSLYSIELDGGRTSRIATGTRRDQIEVALSPDGRWMAYTREGANYHRDLILRNFDSGDEYPVTQGFADVASPAFSRDGAYLYFAASTNSGPTQVGLNMTSQERPYRAGLYAVVLAADGKSPMLPGSGDENADEEESDKDEEEGSKDEDEEESLPETRIDLEGLRARMVALPVAERNYGNLAVADDGHLYFMQYVQPGITNEPPEGNAQDDNALKRFNFEEKEVQSLMSGLYGFGFSGDGKKLLVYKTDGSLAFGEVGDEIKPEPLGLDGVRVKIDPREEWALIFDEVWRMEKEYFYADNMHGLDWQAVYDRFRPLVDHVGRREDLNTVLVEMIAEMQAGHNNVGGGDVHREEGTRTGLLGANFIIENDRYRLTRVYTGEAWNPFIEAPLATPGNEAREGEYLLAVNGQDLTAADNLFERLQGTVGEQVTLKVGPRADGRNAREIVVVPVDSEFSMRLWRWVEQNRQQVDEATDGRVAYVYLPNTAGAGYTFFNRMFFSQIDREAVIIDERSNSGGQAANYITEVLSRRHLSGWKDRDGKIFNTPAGAIHGPKLMLIDQDAGSGGDYLPYSFSHLGIGKLMGTRTWGGLIGISHNPRLIDGGFLTVPFFRFFTPDSQWTIENEGVAPDIEVMLDPISTNQGRDSQLEAAIAEIMDQLEAHQNIIPTEAPPLPAELGQ